MTTVPCNGRTACCRNEFVVLFPERGDDPAHYEHIEVHTEFGPAFVLRQQPNGDCVYLGDGGCTIHDNAPAVCRAFDCRQYFLSMTRQERRGIEKHARHKLAIFAAGRERLSTLTDMQRADALSRRVPGRHTDPRAFLRDMMNVEKQP